MVPQNVIFYILAFPPGKGNPLLRFFGNPVYGGENMKKKEEIIITDPFGSYTGLVKDPNEKPVQDADDL